MPPEAASTETYRHTQFGTVMVLALSAGLLVCVGAAVTSGGHPAALGVAVILAGCLALLYSLTTVVDTEAVRVSFGPGVFSKTIPLSEIESAEPVRAGVLWGWGFRWLPGEGWMWNVSGLRAVRLDYRDGRRFRIGTDDPDGLASAIQRRIAR